MRRRSVPLGAPRPRGTAPLIRVLALALALALTHTACDADTSDPGPADGPSLYLILGERSIDVAGGPDATPQQHAALFTSGGPDGPVVFRSAVRFAMEDRLGRRFWWLPFDRDGFVVREPAADTLHPNWLLSDDPWAGLGAADLTPGRSYSLDVDTEGVLIKGSTTLPGAVDAELAADGTRLSWSDVAGAAGYRVWTDNVATLVSDSVFPLSATQQQATSIVVDALDPNAWAFLTEQTGRAGLDRGLGVFGGITSDTVRRP